MTTLKEYKAMMDGATDAPWGVHKQNQKSYVGNNLIIIPDHINMVVCTIWASHDGDETSSNGKFIAASRNIAPELIRVIELAEEALTLTARHNTNDTDKNQLAVFKAAIDVLSEIRKLKGE